MVPQSQLLAAIITINELFLGSGYSINYFLLSNCPCFSFFHDPDFDCLLEITDVRNQSISPKCAKYIRDITMEREFYIGQNSFASCTGNRTFYSLQSGEAGHLPRQVPFLQLTTDELSQEECQGKFGDAKATRLDFTGFNLEFFKVMSRVHCHGQTSPMNNSHQCEQKAGTGSYICDLFKKTTCESPAAGTRSDEYTILNLEIRKSFVKGQLISSLFIRNFPIELQNSLRKLAYAEFPWDTLLIATDFAAESLKCWVSYNPSGARSVRLSYSFVLSTERLLCPENESGQRAPPKHVSLGRTRVFTNSSIEFQISWQDCPSDKPVELQCKFLERKGSSDLDSNAPIYPKICSSCQEGFAKETCERCWDAIRYSPQIGYGPQGQACTFRIKLPADASNAIIQIQSAPEKQSQSIPDLVIFRNNYMNVSNVINYGSKYRAKSIILPSARNDQTVEFLQPNDVKNLVALCKVRRDNAKGNVS